MQNRIREIREKAGITQQVLADAVGTSQQQIARIEAGGQSIKLGLALRLTRSLDVNLSQLFPEARELLRKGKGEKSVQELVELHYDSSALRTFEAAGVDLDPATWLLSMRLRGGTSLGFVSSTAEAERLRRNLDERNPSTPYYVFHSSQVAVAVNLNHLMHYHELWDSHTPSDWHDERVPSEEVSIWFSDSSEAHRFSVLVDEGLPDDEDEPGQLRHLLFTLETFVEESEFIRFMDEDGEYAFLRAADIALMTIPLRLLDARLDESLLQAERESDDTGSPAVKG